MVHVINSNISLYMKAKRSAVLHNGHTKEVQPDMALCNVHKVIARWPESRSPQYDNFAFWSTTKKQHIC